MVALWQTTRQAWYRLILLIIVLHAVFYGMALLAIVADKQGFCIFFSVVFSVILLVLGLAPDTFGVLLVGSVLWGILPTTGAVANAITVVVKDFVRVVVYLAMVNSFMLFFLGTWNFGRYPGSAAVIIAAALMLGYWGVIYKGDEWFKKIVLWYGVGAIVISLLVSFIPGIVPGKSERELSRTEQLLDENMDKQLTKKQKELQERIQKEGVTRDQLSDTDKKILEETRGFSRTGQAISLAEKVWIFATNPKNRMWWYSAGLVILLVIVFRVLRNSKTATWLAAIAFIAGAFLWIYHEWDSMEKGVWKAKGYLDNAITVNFTIDSLEERSWPNLLPSGRYRIGVSGGEYRFKCQSEMSNPGERPAYADGKIPVVSSVGTGKLIAWSTTSANNPQGNGGEFIVGSGDTIFVKPEVSCLGKVFQTTEVSIQFSPMK